MTEELKALYHASRVTRGGKRLPEQVVSEMLADYARLKSCKKVATLWGVREQNIHRILKRRGATRQRRYRDVVATYRGMRFTADREGYLEVTTPKGRAETRLHRIVWTTERGPIPEGYNVMFKDGDRRNCDISNLECLPVAEVTRRTTRRENGATKDRKLKLMESVERFILLHAGRLAHAYHVESSDLAQAGRLKALRAAECFDPTRGVKFLSYCGNGLINAMRLEAADIGNIVSCPRAKFIRGEAGQWVSLESPLGGRDDSEGTLMDVLPAEESRYGESRADAVQDATAVQSALAAIDSRLRRVLELRYFEKKTLVDAGEEMGVTRTRIHQMEREAITALRRHPELRKLLPAAA